jgi:hypothetical protein
LPGPCLISECAGFFHKSLFFMGEFGVNDYSFSAFGMNISEIKLFVPEVIKTISMATEVIDRWSNCLLAYILGR